MISLLFALLIIYYFTVFMLLVLNDVSNTYESKEEFLKDLIPFRRWYLAAYNQYKDL